MKRREFIALMGASVTWPFAALAQEAGRTYRLGLITSDPFNDPIQGGELIKAKVDVICAPGPPRIRAVQQATKTIPILGIADDMVSSGLVASLAHPNGNTTGVSVLATELNGKRLEILIEAVPGLRRMAALVDVYATSDDRGLEEAARARNVALSIYRVAKGDEIVTAIDTAHASGATALNVSASPTFFINR
jgi:putative ABC transport system substrate-binding protein